jgi:3-methyladenine DNA glycosylase/8-oxoguanine DNA glycosylase
MVEFTHSLTPVLPALLGRVRALFDLDARPDLIARHLRKDARLKSAVNANPGLRVPGAFNGFEMGVRAILGQQVTVKAATTIAGRFVEAFGEPLLTPLRGAESSDAGCGEGCFGERRCHRSTRHHRRQGEKHHRPGESPGIGRLFLDGGATTIPTKRSGGWPSAGGRPVDGALHCHARAALARCLSEGRHRGSQQPRRRHRKGGGGPVQAWRPWRSYAVMHIWRMPH